MAVAQPVALRADFEFPATASVFERWVEGYPLSYSSPNASAKRDVLDRPSVMDIAATI